MSTLSFEPLIPSALWVTLAALAAALLIWYGRARPTSLSVWRWVATLSLMAASIAAVLVILLNPTWVRPIPPPEGKPLLTVLVDATKSMDTPDLAGGKTRYEGASALAAALAKSMGDFEVKVDSFADMVVPSSPQTLATQKPTGQVTDLGAAISDAVDADRPQGQAIVLVSDGGHNAAGGVGPVFAAARRAKAMAAPIFTRTLGGAAGGFDIALQVRSAQEIAFVGQNVNVTADVTCRGMKGAAINVALFHDGKEVSRKAVMLSPTAPQEVNFEIKHDAAGLYQYEIRADVLPGELTAANNTDFFQVRVVDEPIRILLLEGKPYWDSKFLLRTLASDSAVELHSVVKLAPHRLLSRTIARPASAGTGPASRAAASQPAAQEQWQIATDPAQILGTPQSLKPYQIMVLGREAEEFLNDSAVVNLRNWVAREGGALVCYRGSPVAQVNQALGRLMPVAWTPVPESRFRLRLTEQGRDLHWITTPSDAGQGALAQLPTLATDARADLSKPLAVVLATGGGREEPAVTYQPYGSGRVVVVEGEGMWRWAFLPPEDQSHEDLYPGLWHSLLRWLVSNAGLLPGQNFALRGDKVVFVSGENVWATLLMRAQAAQTATPGVELRRIDDATTQSSDVKQFSPIPSPDDPGAFRVAFQKLPPGRYEAHLLAPAPNDSASRIVFQVRDVGQEQLDLDPRPELMARIAQESGGAVLSGDSVDEIGRQLRRQMAGNRPVRVERTSAWDRWWVLAGVVALWCSAWALRRRGGLV